jgi:hypothetical protein
MENLNINVKILIGVRNSIYYLTSSCVNWALYGMRGPLKRE